MIIQKAILIKFYRLISQECKLVILSDEYNIQLFVVVQHFHQVVSVEFLSIVELWILSLEPSLSFSDGHHLLAVVGHDLSNLVNGVIHHVLTLFLIWISVVNGFTFVISQILQRLHGVVHQVDGCINILLAHGVSEMELGLSLRDTDDGQQGSWGDVHVARFLLAFSLELSLFDVSGNDVVMQVSWDVRVEGLGISDE